jgi:hypothetical protein
MKVNDINYYGVNPEAVIKNFEGDLSYVGSFSVDGRARAVFKNANPNREKSHKDFMMLHTIYDPAKAKATWFVSGMDNELMREFLVLTVLKCKKCDDMVYSADRHHMAYCTCKEVAIDGGDVYCKVTGKAEDYEMYTWDVLNKLIVSGPL